MWLQCQLKLRFRRRIDEIIPRNIDVGLRALRPHGHDALAFIMTLPN